MVNNPEPFKMKVYKLTLFSTLFFAASNPALANFLSSELLLVQLDTKFSSTPFISPPIKDFSNILKPTSPIDDLANKIRFLRNGAGLFGKNIRPILKKDHVGIQYNIEW